MAQINQYKLVNNSNRKGLKFHYATAVRENLTFNNVSLAAGGQQTDQNFGANFGGFNRLFTVDFVLRSDGTDKSTDATSKISLSQQRKHLLDTNGILQGVGVGDSQSDVKFTLTLYEDGSTTDYVGIIEDFNLGFEGTGNELKGSLNFKQTSS